MIIAYEPFSIGLNHVPVDSEFLNIIGMRFPSTKIVFYGEKLHIKYIKNNICVNNIEFKEITVVEPTRGRIKAVINELRNAKSVTNECVKNVELFIVLNSHPHTMYFIKKYLNETIPLIFIIHGNIEELKRKKHFYQLGYWIKPAFKYKDNRRNMKYIVLGNSIRANLLKYVDYIDDKTIAIPHPYSLPAYTALVEINDCDTITMGMIGSFSSEKNSDQIFELEKRLTQKGINNIKFLLVGSWSTDYISNNASNENTKISFIGDGTKKLSAEEFNNGIDSLDYILFFWPRDSYQLTASGALCDAIVHNKPIISIRNDYLTWVFNEVGNLGFLCDDINQMENIVCRIAKGEFKNEINDIIKNFDNARKFFSREHVAGMMEEKNVWMI